MERREIAHDHNLLPVLHEDAAGVKRDHLVTWGLARYGHDSRFLGLVMVLF